MAVRSFSIVVFGFIFLASCRDASTIKTNPNATTSTSATQTDSTPDKSIEPWVQILKETLSKLERDFFQGRYLLEEDPFDVQFLSADATKDTSTIPEDLTNLVGYAKEDFQSSWPFLTLTLQKLQKVYSLVSTIPCYLLKEQLFGITGDVSQELEESLTEFQELVEKNQILQSAGLEDIAGVSDLAIVLANEIVMQTIALWNSIQADLIPEDQKTNLLSVLQAVQMLNPVAAQAQGMTLAEDPLKIWGDLKNNYLDIFEVLDRRSQSQSKKLNEKLNQLLRERLEKEKSLLEYLKNITRAQLKISQFISKVFN